jgi:hypothetical protein
MKHPFFVCALGMSALFAVGITLDKTQLIGDRIPFIIEPQDQYLYNVAVDPATGNYFLPWTKQNGKAYGRLFGPKGAKIAPLQNFIGGAIPGQRRWDTHTRVVFNSRFGDYLHGIVAYERRGQFVSSEGRTIGTSWVITQETILIQKLLHNSRANQYAFFYSIVPGDVLTQRIHYLQRLNAQGRLLGKARRLNPPPGDLADAADVDYDPVTNRYLVVWGPGVGIDPGLVKYRTVSADLKTLGPIRAVENTPSTHTWPIVLYDPYKRRHIILWHRDNDIVVRAITSNGSPMGDAVSLGLGLQELKGSYFLAAANAATGSILVGYLSPQTGKSIRLLRIDGDFARIGKPFSCTTQTFTRVGLPLLYYNSLSKEFLAVWHYIDYGPNSRDIYGQRIRGVPLTGTQER